MLLVLKCSRTEFKHSTTERRIKETHTISQCKWENEDDERVQEEDSLTFTNILLDFVFTFFCCQAYCLFNWAYCVCVLYMRWLLFFSLLASSSCTTCTHILLLFTFYVLLLLLFRFSFVLVRGKAHKILFSEDILKTLYSRVALDSPKQVNGVQILICCWLLSIFIVVVIDNVKNSHKYPKCKNNKEPNSEKNNSTQKEKTIKILLRYKKNRQK